VLQFVRLNNSANSLEMIFSQNSSLDEFYADQQGCTALMIAAELGHLDLMTLLMDRGALVNTQRHDGNSALHLASKHENIDAMQLLLQRDADINQVNALGYTALAEAAQNGVTLSLEFLINNSADVNLAVSDGDLSPVFLAAEGGHDEAVGMLISAGADVDAAASTARYTAVQSNHETTLALNNTQFAPPSENDDYSQSASDKLDVDILTPLCVACIMGHIGIVQQLIAAGANVNHTSPLGMSPFSFAYNHFHQEILLMLICFGAIPRVFPPCSDGSFSMNTAV
jgi:ankyrin repeat protein